LCCISGVVFADDPLFEVSTLIDQPQPDRWQAYPCIAKLSDHRMLCVWSDAGDRILASFSKDSGLEWSDPIVLMDHPSEANYDPNITVSGHRVIVMSTTRLPDKIENTSTWCVVSNNDGMNWEDPYEIKMPHRYTSGKVQPGLRLTTGRLLWPYSYDIILEAGDRKPIERGEMDSRAGVMISDDDGVTWRPGGDIHIEESRIHSAGKVCGADEPSLVEFADGSVYALLRTGTDRIWEMGSKDGGETWDSIQPSPLTGHNAPVALCRLQNPSDAYVCVWDDSPKDRWPLVAAVSTDECRTWSQPKTLACVPGYPSYSPNVTQAADGTILAVWQQHHPEKRIRIMLARFNLKWLLDSSNPKSE